VNQKFDTEGDSIFSGLLDPELTFYSDKAWFILSGYVSSQNNIEAQKILMLS
jgi:hypothetical protein